MADGKKELSSLSAGSKGLEGWDFIQDTMKKHDESTTKDLSEDLDALLTFAGLFSAALTAFTVPAYALLQPDSGQDTVDLLRDISGQMRSFSISSTFVNVTAPAQDPPPFDPGAAAIWINCLFFLSLLLSLAAALFAIFAKQWLREFMRWDDVLKTSRDNVLIRQLRYEAWNDWRISATVATIPALLETALVLFVCGVVVLLWTLERTVAIVLTVATALFLMLAFGVKVLPAFYSRCPYRSPTTWAFVLLIDAVYRYGILPIRLRIWRSKEPERETSGPTYPNGLAPEWKVQGYQLTSYQSHTPHSWRDRDLDGCKPSATALHALINDVAAEESESGSTETYDHADWLEKLDKLVTGATEADALVRALGWMSLALPSEVAKLHIPKCMALLRRVPPEHKKVIDPSGDQVRTLLPIRSAFQRRADYIAERPVTSVRKALRSCYTLDEGRQTFVRVPGTSVSELALEHEHAVAALLLATDLKARILHILKNGVSIFERRQVMEISFLLLEVFPLLNSFPVHFPLYQELVEIYNIVHHEGKTPLPGVRFAIMTKLLYSGYTAIKVTTEGLFFEPTRESTGPTLPFIYLAHDMCDQYAFGVSTEDCNLFILVADRMLDALAGHLLFLRFGISSVSTILEEGPRIRDVITKMVWVVETALKEGINNCGYYPIPLPWLAMLPHLTSGQLYPHFETSLQRHIRRLVCLLADSETRGMITGDKVSLQDACGNVGISASGPFDANHGEQCQCYHAKPAQPSVSSWLRSYYYSYYAPYSAPFSSGSPDEGRKEDEKSATQIVTDAGAQSPGRPSSTSTPAQHLASPSTLPSKDSEVATAPNPPHRPTDERIAAADTGEHLHGSSDLRTASMATELPNASAVNNMADPDARGRVTVHDRMEDEQGSGLCAVSTEVPPQNIDSAKTRAESPLITPMEHIGESSNNGGAIKDNDPPGRDSTVASSSNEGLATTGASNAPPSSSIAAAYMGYGYMGYYGGSAG